MINHTNPIPRNSGPPQALRSPKHQLIMLCFIHHPTITVAIDRVKICDLTTLKRFVVQNSLQIHRSQEKKLYPQSG